MSHALVNIRYNRNTNLATQMLTYQILWLLFCASFGNLYFRQNWLFIKNSQAIYINTNTTTIKVGFCKNIFCGKIIICNFLKWKVGQTPRLSDLPKKWPKPLPGQPVLNLACIWCNYFVARARWTGATIKQFVSKRDNSLFNLWVVSWSVPLKCIKYCWEWNTGINIGRYMKCTASSK